MIGFLRSKPGSLFLGGLLAIILGIMVGLGSFTFVYAKGASYLSDSPQACANCHIMNDQYKAWGQGSHDAVAVCNACHMPHDFVNKWFTKALNGFNHSLAFTTGDYPEVITIKDRNAEIVQENCIGCHQTLVSEVYSIHEDQTRRCVSCHGNVGHENRPLN